MKDSDSVFFVELYVIKLISGSLYFCNVDEEIHWFIPGTSTPVTYTPEPIDRGELKSSVDNRVDSCTITVSNVTDDFTSAMFQSFDFRGSSVDIYTICYPDSLGNPQAYTQVFAGYIDQPSLDMSKATFEAALKARMPNLETYRTIRNSCGSWFSDPEECCATQATKTTTVGTGSTQTTIYSSEFTESADHWKNGVCIIGFESKKIIASAVGSVTVDFPFYTVPSQGTPVTVLSGCDKTLADCKRHGNAVNFGGFPAIVYEYTTKT